MKRLRLGTRPSALALRQADQVAAALRRRGETVELVTIVTTGDVRAEVPLDELGTAAAFSGELDAALVEHRIDLAVHSLKDLPTRLPAGLRIVAVGRRADPRDALVSKTAGGIAGLPHGSIVATCSVRRRAQLLRARPDLTVVSLRGNVETRVRKLDESADWSAILLAVAGLERLGLEGRIAERLEPRVMVPAPGQGAIAVTARGLDRALGLRIRRAFHHDPTARSVAAERALLDRLDAGCHFPVAALALVRGPVVSLRGRVLSMDGSALVDNGLEAPAATEPEASALGIALAELLLRGGAAPLLDASAVRRSVRWSRALPSR